jgi:hypothetical protein
MEPLAAHIELGLAFLLGYGTLACNFFPHHSGETLKGHEGHYLRVEAHVYADKNSIHIIEVKMPTASESRKNDMR